MENDRNLKNSSQSDLDSDAPLIKTAKYIISKLSSIDNDGIIKHIIESGVDLSTRNAVKLWLSKTRNDTNMADKLFMLIKNDLNRNGFLKTPYSERALFLPQCLRNADRCTAKMDGVGYVCKHCGACPISNVKRFAEELGYSVFVVPGGSMVFKIITATKPKAVVGVACDFELGEACEKLTSLNIFYQGVPLLKDGCKNTVVDVEKLLEILKNKV
ncbi:MAG: DUF116 domain-containing protein [Thermoplasmata archaeon]